MASLKRRTSSLELHNHLYPVIMAGGSGTRFWPLSRQLSPIIRSSCLGNNCRLSGQNLVPLPPAMITGYKWPPRPGARGERLSVISFFGVFALIWCLPPLARSP